MMSAVDLTFVQATALAAAFFLGGFVKGGLGFAFPIIILAITTHFVEFDLTLAAISVLQPFVNIFQFASMGKMYETLFRFWPMILGLAIGAPIGALLLPIIDRQILVFAVGLFIIGFVFWLLFRPMIGIPPHAERRAGGIFGIAAGMLGTLTTMNGPVFVTYLVSLRLDRAMMVSALGLLFLISGVLNAASFLAIGVLNGERFLIALGCAVPCAIGIWSGNVVARLIPAEPFRKVVLVSLFLLGANMTLRSIPGL